MEAAFGTQFTALPCQLDAACDGLDTLALASRDYSYAPRCRILTSFPGLARVLAESAIDRTSFATAGSLRAHAGAAR